MVHYSFVIQARTLAHDPRTVSFILHEQMQQPQLVFGLYVYEQYILKLISTLNYNFEILASGAAFETSPLSLRMIAYASCADTKYL